MILRPNSRQRSTELPSLIKYEYDFGPVYGDANEVTVSMSAAEARYGHYETKIGHELYEACSRPGL